jgi:hypothetical protein
MVFAVKLVIKSLEFMYAYAFTIAILLVIMVIFL